MTAVIFEQFMQWRWGTMGMVAATVVLIGHKSRNNTCLCLGGVLVVLLLLR